MPEVVVFGISTGFPELSRSEGQIAHVLLTRSPLIHPRRGFTARLACVKHAASVRPEPGSNSPLMLCVRAARARRRRGQQRKAAASRERPGSLRDLANVQTSLASVFTKGIRPRIRRTVRSADTPGTGFWH